ncbi:MAG: NADP-dependent malic enzyme [Rhodobacteraceae bacterium]|nr:NADP-dependent malic enzyme [Paracoccaceae bacterium]
MKDDARNEETAAVKLDEDALRFHQRGRPGKLEVIATKPVATQRDLSLAYSPGVAAPVRAIGSDPDQSYDYTARGNLVAVITNGTAILGLGNLGAAAAKPVMEGKAVLFKRFADIDSFDIELATEDAEQIIQAVKLMEPTFGGVNLEDIKAPDCFIIEQRLREEMNIPVFHDDQHGTAIICLAGLINAMALTGRRLEDARIVLNGAGAAGIACLELVKAFGAKPENCIACDTKGVIYKGRKAGMNQWKSAHAVETPLRTLEEAMRGADVFLGVSVKGAVTAGMVRSMADKPIIFAMANPDPEISAEEAAAVRSDIIFATGRSDYPNQINNVLGFPYIFRGALDVRASRIDDNMKIAAARAIANLARETPPEEVAAAYGSRLSFGPSYIVPAPFDPRLLYKVPPAVARAAMESGVARRPVVDFQEYERSLRTRMDPTASILQALNERLRLEPKRVVFAEGDDERVVRAAVAYKRAGCGEPVLVGQSTEVAPLLEAIGYDSVVEGELSVVTANAPAVVEKYVASLYERLQRQGFLLRDCRRMVTRDRHIFAASMLTHGDADAMVTGATRKSTMALGDIRRVIDAGKGQRVVGVSALLARSRTVLIADTLVHETPTEQELADIACCAAGVARRLGLEPRVAMLSASSFGYPQTESAHRIRDAVSLLQKQGVDFEVDGEMAADVALDPSYMAQYPFCRLGGAANVLVMPSRDAASIATKLAQQLEGSLVIGPILVGLDKPVQICSMNATVSDLLNAAVLAGCRIG